MLLAENFAGYKQFKRQTPPLTGEVVEASKQYTAKQLNHFIGEFKQLTNVASVEAAVILKMMEELLRNHHEFIRKTIFATYRQKDVLTQKGTVFEHVIPVGQLSDLLIKDKIPMDLALYPPVCTLKKAKDKELKRLGLEKTNPDPFVPFKRYAEIGVSIETYRGDAISIDTWTLQDHMEYFKL